MSYQQPPQYPGQPPYGQPPYGGPPQPPRKKRHRIRNTFLAIAGVFVVLIVVIVAVAASSSSNGSHSTSVAAGSASSPSATASASAASAPSSPAPQPPTEIEFVITGDVPATEFGNVDINYGSDSDHHDVQESSLNGTLTYKLPFDSSAEYYSVDVNISSGQASCKIVVIGPAPDQPTTVSSGTASGSSLCSAQAAPENGGLSWDNEN